VRVSAALKLEECRLLCEYDSLWVFANIHEPATN
jgi:hypothetical protein